MNFPQRYLLPLVLSARLLTAARLPAEEEGVSTKVEFRDGDRVVLLGAAFIERLQNHGYLEAWLTASHPDRRIAFRNLGWSGDTVEGISRAVFGSPDDGFKRLVSDVNDAKPTMILVCYGDNEAHRGKAGLRDFNAGLNRLLDALEKTGARLALVSPLEREDLGRPLPDPREYNESLELYREALRTTAADRGLPYIELNPLMEKNGDQASSGENPLNQLTANTLHLTPYGHWRAAPIIASRLGVPVDRWSIEVNAADGTHRASETEVSAVKASRDGVGFEATDRRLPLPPPPPHSPDAAWAVGPQRVLRVVGLAPGHYELRIDGEPVARADADSWAKGAPLTAGPQYAQAEALRRTIGEKNELYFHRYRPQNETYLFLFRKHEQGNNAVEIPQFDPLIEAKEQEIAELRVPRKHRYELVRVPR